MNKKTLVWFIFILLAVVLLVVVLPTGMFCGRETGWHGMMGGWHMGYGGVIMWLIVIVIVGIIVYFLLKEAESRKGKSENEALEILKKRFARGEISKEEYEEMRKKLEE
jgi:putative membrane protein